MSWSLTADGTLTYSGNGLVIPEMWMGFVFDGDVVKKIVVNEGATEVREPFGVVMGLTWLKSLSQKA